MKTAELIYRVIDANVNRAKEGLRVCEEITRFILEDKRATAGLKQLRHRIDGLADNLPDDRLLIRQRDIVKDSGRNLHLCEFKREGVEDIFFANMQRVKESLRVLEEFAKLEDKNTAIGFKRIRYSVYEFEKRVAEKIGALLHHRPAGQ